MLFKGGSLLIRRVLSGLTISIIIVVVVSTLSTNSAVKEIIKERNPVLDTSERTKLWIIEDIRSLLEIKDVSSYTNAKKSCHFTLDLVNKVYGKGYNASKFPKYDSISIIDAQYTLLKDEPIYLITANAKNSEGLHVYNFLVYVTDNYIYDIKVI